MSILSGRQIKELVKAGELVIDPFDESLVMPASYDLRVGQKILASPLGPEEFGATVELNHKTPSYRIQTGQMVAVMSKERLRLPLHICSGGFGIRSEYARKGVIAFGGVQLDPGWSGRLVMNLQNVGPEPITITRDAPLFTVEFQRLEEPASEGYVGKYQNQDDFPDDQYEFILSARTTSLAEIPALRKEVARLNVLLQEFEEILDPDDGLHLKPSVNERLRRSMQRAPGSLISIEEARRRTSTG